MIFDAFSGYIKRMTIDSRPKKSPTVENASTTAALRSFVATHLTVASDAHFNIISALNLKRLIVLSLFKSQFALNKIMITDKILNLITCFCRQKVKYLKPIQLPHPLIVSLLVPSFIPPSLYKYAKQGKIFFEFWDKKMTA